MGDLAQPQCREDFKIALVCALSLEYDAATLAFDELWDENGDRFGRSQNDPNNYTTGRIGRHNVVLALLPNMGKTSSSGAAAALRSSYTGLKLAILAGVCGGVPGSGDEVDEMILGDVVISKSVIQFDLGRQYPDKFSRKDTIHDNLGRSNLDIRSLLAVYESDFGRGRLERGCADVLEKIQRKAVKERRRTRYGRPPPSEDTLFKSAYLHLHQNWEQTGGHLVPRDRLADSETQSPQIFIGNVASGDTVMKSGDRRDKLAQEHGIIAFEMEGAGMWDQIPCIIVKGVCDYADSHKNKKWQPYAAIAAASVTKALLERYIQEDKPRDLDSSSSSGGVARQFNNTGNGTQKNNSGAGKQYVAETMTFH
ncbi:phosphorylase superfamily protein [Colletotrichum chrysophilum]|uniref:Phosphorylase superfamily protein n=1 Tax=Colletotrichum chrysophilum TaxID=1836956 RepID=A0AAD9AXV3_9PEZI|nr:phosphorylase superfamily protein [Colletotrichum chrysophilum]